MDTIKAMYELKAENLTAKRLDRWLSGEISRRILVVPFGGPLPSEKSSLGVDVDEEWFDSETDLYGPFPSLRESRERVVDWHHDDHGVKGRPSKMKGADLGRITLDVDPEDDGYWADWWTNVGEDRRRLIAALERRGTPLYGSSQAVYKMKADSGHIDVWPLIRHTITTSPQNTYAVVPPLKALLAYPSIDEMPADAVKALVLGLDATTTELLLSSPDAAVQASALVGDEAVKAGRVLSTKNLTDLRAAIVLLGELLSRGVLPLEEEQETSD